MSTNKYLNTKLNILGTTASRAFCDAIDAYATITCHFRDNYKGLDRDENYSYYLNRFKQAVFDLNRYMNRGFCGFVPPTKEAAEELLDEWNSSKFSDKEMSKDLAFDIVRSMRG